MSRLYSVHTSFFLQHTEKSPFKVKHFCTLQTLTFFVPHSDLPPLYSSSLLTPLPLHPLVPLPCVKKPSPNTTKVGQLIITEQPDCVLHDKRESM